MVLEKFFDEKKYDYDDINKLLHNVPLVNRLKNIRNEIRNKIRTSDNIGSNLKRFISDSLVRKGGYKWLNKVLEFFNNDKFATHTIEKLILIAFKEIST